MASPRGRRGSNDFWSEIAGSEGGEQQQVGVTYGRRKPQNVNLDVQINRYDGENRLSLAPTKRISWNRSLSTRGRKSIVVPAGTNYRPQIKQKEAKKKGFQSRKQPLHPPDFAKERAYFQEVDSVELLEESPSPKNFGTWAMGAENIPVIEDLCSILDNWLVSKKLTYGCGSSGPLSRIMETARMPMDSIADMSDSSVEKTPETSSASNTKGVSIYQDRISSSSRKNNVLDGKMHLQESSIINGLGTVHSNDVHMLRDSCSSTKILADTSFTGGVEEAIRKLSLTSCSASARGDHHGTFAELLSVCGQSVPSQLGEVFAQYCDLNTLLKIGEGTYGEAFKAGATVCKIVPIDGDLRVNGEIQKKSSELLEEVLLCWTLSSLRGQAGQPSSENTCTNFIETKDVRVCQGAYDASLIRAWEDWDGEHGSENDNPKEFPEKQCYVVFVLADGGSSLESFVLLNFDEARSFLLQVTAALAVAEVACEFEHRDLHWGNILLTRKGDTKIEFTLQGKRMWAKTFGLCVSIIDFTLSRIKAGESILFFDLSADPELFEGPKGDRQSETYRKMKEVTDECWEGSFPKTNVLWLQYLVDILLLKKTFQRTAKDERTLRSFKKCLNSYDSAKDALSDAFFSELWVDQAM